VSEAEEQEELSCGQGETVLLVEDSPEVLDPIRAMLERLEYRVLTATNGLEALGVYDQHRDEIDLVLTDMVMPGMRGSKLFHTLREQDPDVKVVVMSGYPLQQEETTLLSQGVSAWVQKPVKIGTLSRLVRDAFA